MSILDGLGIANLPPTIRIGAANHLAKLLLADTPRSLRLALERARGFVEGVDLARALNRTTVDTLLVAIEHVAAGRSRELAV